MKPRVLVLTDKFAPHPGGTAVLWAHWCARWPPGQVTVIAPWTPGCEDYDARQAYRIIRIAYPDIPKLRMPLLWLLITLRAVWELWRRPVDVVHLAQIVPFGLLGPLFRRPYILHFYGEDLNALLRCRWKMAIVRRLLQRARAVTAISRFTAGLVARAGFSGPVLLVPPAPSGQTRLGHDRPSGRGSTLLTLARLSERKGQDRVLAILPELLAHHPDLTYLIAGIGPYESRLRELAGSLPVRFLGRVPDEQIADLYLQADIFVHPNRELAGGDVEGFGIVLLEASLSGLPVIAGRSGGAVEAVQDGVTGILVSDSAHELKSALMRLLDDAQLRAEMGRQGRLWAQRFDWETPARAVWELTLDATTG